MARQIPGRQATLEQLHILLLYCPFCANNSLKCLNSILVNMTGLPGPIKARYTLKGFSPGITEKVATCLYGAIKLCHDVIQKCSDVTGNSISPPPLFSSSIFCPILGDMPVKD